MNPKVDFYFLKTQQWREALEHLRALALECGLTEVLKWGVPCYTYNGRNILLLHVFKEYCAVLFFKGALLRSAPDLLVQQTANTQAARQLRFTTVGEVVARKAVVKACIREALEVEQKGCKWCSRRPKHLRRRRNGSTSWPKLPR
ncbi:DUF1801 domain-containing protein [Hymenobacter sp. IS2118]|uniref:DUF1801 domain-containing protein n=1 Tax=Hymenobacter sp. IS2118 TaxID=1505605 RepID=UPI000B182F57|nr:DUF1801 domain-containing protein [Hymenobacter sp. IS2118]